MTIAGVTVDKPLILQSVNGSAVTVIDGASAVRCVYLSAEATLVGFTLTNGAADNGGGVWCASASAAVSNCVLNGNSAYRGGGAFWGTLNNCTLAGNFAYYGGGAYVGNGTLNNCALIDNHASYGGGSIGGALHSCILAGNSAGTGGGAYDSMLNSCNLTGNSAGIGGGGGAIYGMLNNCIVYYNTAADGANYTSDSTLNYCCTTPLPTSGVGNIDADPQLASASHLSAGSPCRGAGSAAYATGLDIDDDAWASPPSIGCDEYHPGAIAGPLSVAV
jgi:hypothetical protein